MISRPPAARLFFTMLLFVLPVPCVTSARTVIGLAGTETAKSAELRDELEQKLANTDRYVLIPATAFSPAAPVCPDLPRPDYILSIHAAPSSRAGKLAGKIRIFDCLKKSWLVPVAEGSSAKVPSLASNLKDDLVEILPFTEKLEMNGSAPCVAGGKPALIHPGKRLWWHDRAGELLGRWIVTEEAPAGGCARLAPDYRVMDTAVPLEGQRLTDHPPFVRKPRIYGVPHLSRTVREEILPSQPAGAGEIPAGWFQAGSLPADRTAWFAELSASNSNGRERAVWWNTGFSRSQKSPRPVKSGYRFGIGRSGWKLALNNGNGKLMVIASGKQPRLTPDGSETAIRIVHEGRYSEIYVDGRFVTGLDDESQYGGGVFIESGGSEPPASAAVYSARAGNGAQPLN